MPPRAAAPPPFPLLVLVGPAALALSFPRDLEPRSAVGLSGERGLDGAARGPQWGHNGDVGSPAPPLPLQPPPHIRASRVSAGTTAARSSGSASSGCCASTGRCWWPRGERARRARRVTTCVSSRLCARARRVCSRAFLCTRHHTLLTAAGSLCRLHTPCEAVSGCTLVCSRASCPCCTAVHGHTSPTVPHRDHLYTFALRGDPRALYPQRVMGQGGGRGQWGEGGVMGSGGSGAGGSNGGGGGGWGD